MKLEEIKELLKAVCETDVTELEIEKGDEKVRIRRGVAADDRPSLRQGPLVVVSPGIGGSFSSSDGVSLPAGAASSQAPAKESDKTDKADDEESLTIVSSPIVGTFYEAGSPGAPAFVEVGDRIAVGQTLCIIEAMKLMNEIEAEVAGVVVKRFVSNAQPVEYGEALFAIRPESA